MAERYNDDLLSSLGEASPLDDAIIELCVRSGWLQSGALAYRARVPQRDLSRFRNALVASAVPHVIVSGAPRMPALFLAQCQIPAGALAIVRGHYTVGSCTALAAAEETAEHLSRGGSVSAWPDPFGTLRGI